MSFVHPLLLGGLLLAAIPVLLHLIQRQKPKRLLFPAFRFLLQRVKTNQRKLRLRHLLLLLLRIGLVVLICMALARPKVSSDGILPLGAGQPVAAALVFDTSMSMEYEQAKASRLAEAQKRALELLDELPDGSRVAIFNSAEPASGEWLDNLQFARERIAALKPRPDNGPVTDAVAQAYRLLAGLDDESTREPWPRFLYVFSDRTQESWDPGRVPPLIELRDRILKNVKVPSLLVDVGVEKPEDLAVVHLRLDRQVVPAGRSVRLRATVQATGRDYEAELVCRVDGKQVGRQPVKLGPGASKEIIFDVRDLQVGPYHAEVVLESDHQLPWDNARFASFEVIGPRQILTVADRPADARIWEAALDKLGEFKCEIKLPKDASNLAPAELAKYEAICLLNVSEPTFVLWEKLHKYVVDGGGLAIIPGGEELDKDAYFKEKDKDKFIHELMPARFEKVVEAEPGVRWDESRWETHPIVTPFREWAQKGFLNEQVPREAIRYWEVKPLPESATLASYADKEKRPALVERKLDREKFRGKVVLLTTPLDGRRIGEAGRPWNNYLQSWFYQALADKVVGYLAGVSADRTLNFTCGQPVLLALPVTPRFPSYTLTGPGLEGQAAQVARPENAAELRLPQATLPGNYTLTGADGQWKTAFSLSIPSNECQLARIKPEEIEKLFGPDSVLTVKHNMSFKDQRGEFRQPVELFPYLMILLLLVLAVENLLANRFYRREETAQAEQPGKPSV